MPTFDEVIALAQELGRELGRPIGVYPETKHPTYFRGIGLPLEEKLLASLDKSRMEPPRVAGLHPVVRERQPARAAAEDGGPAHPAREHRRRRSTRLDSKTSRPTPTASAREAAGRTGRRGWQPGPPTDLVARAHAAGLLVHVWTLRIDKEFLPAGYKGRAEAEFEQFRDLGVDGLFTDFPDVAARVYGVAPIGRR